MDPVSIFGNILGLATKIYKQAGQAKANKSKISRLVDRLKIVISSIQSLVELPRQQQFINGLLALEKLVTEIEDFNKQFLETGAVKRFFSAGSHRGQFDTYSESLAACLSQLNVGLSAQQLIDREQDRCDEEEDRRFVANQFDEVLAQQEKTLRLIQETRLDKGDLESIMARQVESMRSHMAECLKIQPEQKKSILPAHQQINFYDIVFDKKIAEGSFGSIYRGTWREQNVAIKLIERVASVADREQFVREAQIMSRLQSEYIVPFYGACLEEGRLCILMSYMDNGDLEFMMGTLNQDERLEMARDLAKGLHYLHEQKIFHGDIKPRNVLINKYKQAKWADFGLSKTQQSSIAELNLTSQSAHWQAPESWQSRDQISFASDIYSFGMLLWALMTGRQPYAHLKTDLDVIQKVQSGLRETMDACVPDQCQKLIERCWSVNPLMRPRTAEIIQVLNQVSLRPELDATGLYNKAVEEHKKNNLTEAYNLYEQAANKGFVKAYTSLGLFSLTGIPGRPVDKVRAINFLERGVEGGHSRAFFNLARVYEKGEGVAKNIEKALDLYKNCLALEPGNKDAQSKVEVLSSTLGVSQTGYAMFSNG